MRFSNDVVVVTGAARGIGNATATRFAKEGADVVIADVDHERAEEVAAELPGNGQSLAVKTDVSDQADVQTLAELVADEFGHLTVLVNNAGVSQTVEPTVDQSVEEWERVVDIHLKGTYLCSKFLAPLLLDADSASIVNISSTTAFGAFPYRTAYGPAKSAIRNLTKVFAVEWATDGVRVNAVAPSYVRTALVQNLIDRGKVDETSIKDRTPMAKLAEPEYVADAVAFLASHDAQFITGVTLPVDGGWTAYGHF